MISSGYVQRKDSFDFGGRFTWSVVDEWSAVENGSSASQFISVDSNCGYDKAGGRFTIRVTSSDASGDCSGHLIVNDSGRTVVYEKTVEYQDRRELDRIATKMMMEAIFACIADCFNCGDVFDSAMLVFCAFKLMMLFYQFALQSRWDWKSLSFSELFEFGSLLSEVA